MSYISFCVDELLASFLGGGMEEGEKTASRVRVADSPSLPPV